MTRPIEVELPHRLGRDEARRRIAANIGSLQQHIPGGANHVESRWDGDTLQLEIGAMGQNVAASIGVEEDRVRCRIALPGMLAMFAGPIEAMLKARGPDLLLEDRRGD